MNPQGPILELPLHGLVEKLESAGFLIGVDTRLQMLTILNKIGSNYLKQPYKLKSFLAPVVAKTRQEQELFYKIFDHYYQEACEPFPTREVNSSPWDRIRGYLLKLWWLLPTLLLALLTLLLYFGNRNPAPMPFFDVPDTVAVGDTVVFKGSYLSDGAIGQSGYEFQWSIDKTQLNEPLVFTRIFREIGPRVVSLQARYGEKNPLFEKFRYLKSDSILSRIIQVVCPDLPELQIIIEPSMPIENSPITFTADLMEWVPGQATFYWEVDGREFHTPSFRHTISAPGIHDVTLVVEEAGTEAPCNTSRAHKSFEVGSGDESPLARISLNAKTIAEDTPRFEYLLEKDQFIRFITLGSLVILSLFIFERFRHLRKTRSGRSSILNFVRQPLDNAPYLLPIPVNSSGIRTEQDIYELAQGLQQRVASDIRRIDLPATVRATTREAGLLELVYKSYTRKPEYLALIDGSADSNHQSRLFEHLVGTLKKENVLIDTFYFDVTPKLCYNREYPEGLDLKELHRKYPDHRLLIFGQGYQMLYTNYPILREWVESDLKDWNYRMILTPTPYKIWGIQEQALQRFFTVLPVDLKGELLSFQAFQNVDNKLLLKQLDKLDLQESCIDPLSITEVQQYLGQDTFLFYWLAALAIYPKLNWNLTIPIGKGILDQCSAYFNNSDGEFPDSQITYSNILKLSRIKWLQKGHIPEEMRLQLLTALPPEIEKVARAVLLSILEDIKLPSHAMANRELQIHRITNRYLQNPGDHGAAEEMYLLWKSDLITDPQLKNHLIQNRSRLLGKDSSMLFQRLKPFRPFISAILTISLLALMVFILSSGNNLENLSEGSIFGFLVENQADSAIYYNNLGAVSPDQEGAMGYFNKALNFRNDYSLALSNKEHLRFNLAVDAYNNADYEGAIQDLNNLRDTTSITLDVWYALGLSFLYLEQEDSVLKYHRLITAQDSSFYSTSDLPDLADLTEAIIPQQNPEDTIETKPVPKIPQTEVVIPAFIAVRFPDLGPAPTTDEIADQSRWLTENQDYGLELIGHAFDSATSRANLLLGYQRADQLRRLLIRQGIQQHRLKVYSFGDTQPTRAIDPDRVEFRVLSPRELKEYVEQEPPSGEINQQADQNQAVYTDMSRVLEVLNGYLGRVENFLAVLQNKGTSSGDIETYNAALGGVNDAYRQIASLTSNNQNIQQGPVIFDDLYEDFIALHRNYFSQLNRFSLDDIRGYTAFIQQQGSGISDRITKELYLIQEKMRRLAPAAK